MSVLETLVRHYERLHASGEAPPYGYSRERIAYALVLSDAGEPVAVSSLSGTCAQSPPRRLFEVPYPVRRTSQPVANFLWDKTAHVLGAKRDPVTRKACPANREHDAFRLLHEALLSETADEGLQALLRFVRTWDPQHYERLPHAEAMLGQNVIFRLEGDDQWLHERPVSRSVWTEHLSRDRGPKGVCLVTGARAPIARVHPSIRGVPGTHAAGAALVTFNLDTFESYGKTQGANAPISIHTAFALEMRGFTRSGGHRKPLPDVSNQCCSTRRLTPIVLADSSSAASKMVPRGHDSTNINPLTGHGWRSRMALTDGAEPPARLWSDRRRYMYPTCFEANWSGAKAGPDWPSNLKCR